MSFVFGGKLMGQDGPVVDTTSLEKLSKNEKLLLVELERTRNSIAQELGVLKQCKGGDTSALDDAIVAYTEQKRGELYLTKNDATRFYDTSRRGKALRGVGSVNSKVGRSKADAQRRQRMSATMGATPTSTDIAAKTALDILPVFSSMRSTNQTVGRNYGKSKTLPFKMPVFSLPPISLAVQNGSIRAVCTPPPAAASNRFAISKSYAHSQSTSSLPGASSFAEPTQSSDMVVGASSGSSKSMSADEAIACSLYLLFTSQHISDVNTLLNIGMDPFSRKKTGSKSVGKDDERAEELRRVSSFNAVAHLVRPPPPAKTSNDFIFNNQGGDRSKTTGGIEYSSHRGHSLDSMQSSDDVTMFGDLASSLSGLPGGPPPRGRSSILGESTNQGISVGGTSSRGKSKFGPNGGSNKMRQGGRLAALSPVVGSDRMPSKNCGADELRAELLRSLTSMQKFTVLVKEDILSVSDVVDVKNPKAKAMMLAVAAERMRNILSIIVSRDLLRGFKAWQLSISQLRSVEKLKIFIRFRNVRHFAAKLVWSALRFFKRKFRHWRSIAQAEALRLKRERENASALNIQRVFRGYLGRRRVENIEDAKKYASMYRATVKIQALFRCKGRRWRYLRYQRDKSRLTSTIMLQRVARGLLGRKRFWRVRLQANRGIAATMIQSLARGVAGRKAAKKKAHLRNCIRAAVFIQAQMRGFLTRQMVDRILEEKMRDWGVRFIQRVVRGVLCRMNMQRKRKEIEDYKTNRIVKATRVQAVYRGFRGRIMARAHIVQKRRKQTKLAAAANKLIKMVRAFNARSELKNRKKERLLKWVADASRWKETWSDDAQAWFYLNEDTGDAAWEPSSDGYTRADGQLVLANGTTVDYYNIANGGEVIDVDKVRLHNCIECAYRTAIRACNECGDAFCTKCYNETHAIGGRRTHTYTAVGPIDCSECEEVLAERWCVACDESYCDECWRKVHNHGKRRMHPFSKVAPTGAIAPTMFTIDGEQVYEYTTMHAQHQHSLEQDSQTLATAESSTVGWDQSGYYNDQGSATTADAGGEQGYYDVNGQYVYYDTSQYDTSQYDTSQYDASQYDENGNYIGGIYA